MRAMFISLITAACASTPVQASELVPIEGFSLQFGEIVGTAYFTVEKEGHQLVATVTSAGSSTPIRFIATLLDGQKVMLSVPRAVGESALEVQFERRDERLFVNRIGDLNN